MPRATEVDTVVTVSSTGIATPSLEARAAGLMIATLAAIPLVIAFQKASGEGAPGHTVVME
jgi:predicted naringenin-chalcone synthase